jgi:hypothetical protein
MTCAPQPERIEPMSHSRGSRDDKASAEEQASLFSVTAKPKAAVDDRVGHRRRLRDRFQNGGADAVPDYELLEMILFRAFPRIDTKPIAKRLIAKFGSFAEVVSAAPERLKGSRWRWRACGRRAEADQGGSRTPDKGRDQSPSGALLMARRARLSAPGAGI